jgi:hypothetical protein
LIVAGVPLYYGIAGALLMEMSLQERIEIVDGLVVLKNDKKITDPMMSEMAGMMRQQTKRRKVRYWAYKINKRANRFKKELLSRMDKKGVLRLERKRFLWLIPYTVTYLRDRRTRDKLIRHLRKAVLYPSSVEVTSEDVALLGLIEAAKMHKVIAENKDELKRIRKELKKVIEESPIAGVVAKTIKDVQAAIIVTTVVVGGGR